MADHHANRAVQLSGERVILTDEGSISGELEVGVADDGTALVRYAGTEKWFAISHRNKDTSTTVTNPEELVTLIEGTEPTTDPAGNTQPFRL